jgi:hypothetical protein
VVEVEFTLVSLNLSGFVNCDHLQKILGLDISSALTSPHSAPPFPSFPSVKGRLEKRFRREVISFPL